MIYPPQISYISIGNINIHFYGLIIALSIIVCVYLLDVISKKIKTELSCDVIYDILPITVIFSILGARLYYVLLNFNYYFYHPKEIFMIWQGGLSIHGAILAGFLSIILILKIKKFQILPYLDVFACVLPLGQAVGRWGNYVNQEAFGTPCHYIWCMYIEPALRPLNYKTQEFFHPAFLYESILDFIVFILLFVLLVKCKKLKSGIIASGYIILYSLVRIVVELIRTDAAVYILGIPFPVFVSIIFLFMGIILITLIYKR